MALSDEMVEPKAVRAVRGAQGDGECDEETLSFDSVFFFLRTSISLYIST